MALLRAGIMQRRLRATQLREVLSQSLPPQDAARRAGVPVETLVTAAANGELITVCRRGRLFVPLWQLTSTSVSGILPGVAEVWRAYCGSDVSLTRWMLRSNVEFDGRSPLEVLCDGDVDGVARTALYMTSAGW